MAQRKKKKKTSSAKSTPWYMAIAKSIFSLAVTSFLLVGSLIMKVMPSGEWWANRLRSHRTKVYAGVVVSLLLFVLCLAWMQGYLEQQERYRIDPSRISISAGEITWAKGEGQALVHSMVSNDLYTRLKALPQTSAFDDEILGQVAESLKESPWVQQVNAIERHFPSDDVTSSLHVDMKVRKPVLLVEMDYEFFFVDKESVVLPYFIKLDRNGQPNEFDRKVLTNLDASVRRVVRVGGQRPTPGSQWTNEQILGAISVETALRQYNVDTLAPIAALDVSDVGTQRDWRGVVPHTPGRGVAILLPKELSNSLIMWGKAPLHSSSLEPSVADKVERLRTIANVDPGFQLNNVYYLNGLKS